MHNKHHQRKMAKRRTSNPQFPRPTTHNKLQNIEKHDTPKN